MFDRGNEPEEENETSMSAISNLSNRAHDRVFLYKLASNRTLKERVYQQVQIIMMLEMMYTLITEDLMAEIKEVFAVYGNFAAVERFFKLSTMKKLKAGWSRHLIQVLDNCGLKDLATSIRPSQEDLDDFNTRIGIPRDSLLDRIGESLKKFGGTLLSPMGIKDSDEETRQVPVVHPQLCISENHYTKNTAYTDGRYRPLEEERRAYAYSEKVYFDDITRTTDREAVAGTHSSRLKRVHDLYLMMIGPAGSGKTTITKRIMKTCIETGKFAFLISFHHLSSSDLWSLKDLLIGLPLMLHTDYRPTPDEIAENFEWVLDNQDKCLLIFDGYDQSTFEVSDDPVHAGIHDKLYPAQLVSLILTRQFLPNVRLIISSRPHSILNFTPPIQPDIVIYVNDLEEDAMQALMSHYVSRRDLDQMLKTLRMKSPRIHQLMYNPLFLRLIAMLYKEAGLEVWSYINTAAKLFYELLERHQDSAHYGSERSVDDLDLKLGQIAFDKTLAGSVMIRQHDLDAHGLKADDVQDLVFAVVEIGARIRNSSVVGLMMFYFHHQSVQEFYTSRYGLEELSLDRYKEFVTKLFPSILRHSSGHMRIDKQPLMVVRMFIIGCINEIEDRELIDPTFGERKSFFIKTLCQHIPLVMGEQLHWTNREALEHQRKIMMDMMDFRKAELIEEIRSQLEDEYFWILFINDTIGEREGFFYFLEFYATNFKELDLHLTNWDQSEVNRFFSSIRARHGKVEVMWVRIHEISPRVEDVIGIFCKITNKLTLEFNKEVDIEFFSAFHEALFEFDTTTLQTEKMELKVLKKYEGIPLLEAEITKD